MYLQTMFKQLSNRQIYCCSQKFCRTFTRAHNACFNAGSKELPKILLERVGVDNPQMCRKTNNYLSKRSYYARGKFSDVRFAPETVAMMNLANEEAEKRSDEQISIEHLILALLEWITKL